MTGVLQTILNRFLNCSPRYFSYLEEVAGLVITIKLTDFPLKFSLAFHHSFIEVLPEAEDPTLVLSGRLIDFIIFASQKNKRQQLLQAQRIDFKGELLQLEKIENFLNNFNFKFLALLPLSQVKRFLKNQVEYWQEEKQLIASEVLTDHLKDSILTLQQDLDRVDAKIKKIGQGLSASEDSSL